MCVTPDGKHVVSGSGDKTVRIWSLESGQLVRQLDGHTDRVYSVCVTPDGKHVVSGSYDKTVRIWSVESGEFVRFGTSADLNSSQNRVGNVSVDAHGKSVLLRYGEASSAIFVMGTSVLGFKGCSGVDDTFVAPDACRRLIVQLS